MNLPSRLRQLLSCVLLAVSAPVGVGHAEDWGASVTPGKVGKHAMGAWSPWTKVTPNKL
jgi:hypothetical protein